MLVELRKQRALRLISGAICLALAVFPWTLPIPLWLKILATGASVTVALPHFSRKEQLHALHIGPCDTLSATVSSASPPPENQCVMRIRSLRVTRLYRCYIEMTLKLENTQKTSVLIFPGVCTPGAIRHLRRFLLRVCHAGVYAPRSDSRLASTTGGQRTGSGARTWSAS